MPVDPITVDTTILAAGEVQPSWGSVLLVGENEGGVLGVNTVTRYTNLADLATDFLNSSKVYKAAVNLIAQGVDYFYAVKINKTTVAVENTAAGAAHTLDFGPVKGGTVAIAAFTIEYDYKGPPEDPGASKAQIGTEGTQIFINGAVAKDVAYDYYVMSTFITAVKDYERLVDIIYFCAYTDGTGGNGGAGPQDWGILANIADIADTYAWIMPICGRGDEVAATQLKDLKTDAKLSYTSRNIITIAHLDTNAADDVGAVLAGRIAVTEPWDKIMWKTLLGLHDASISQFTKSQVTAFEAASENALILKQSMWRPSDGLSMAGGSSAYKFIDVTRTRYYLEENIIWDLETLIANNPVPFDKSGIDTVKACIEQTLQNAVELGALKQPFMDNGTFRKGFVVNMPDYDDITAGDKTARLLDNIYVTVYLTGHIESITINLAISV